MQTYKMKHLENEVKSQGHDRSLNKNAVHLTPAETQPSLVSCHSPIDEVAGKYKTILVTTEDKITKIMLNLPDKKNALSLEGFFSGGAHWDGVLEPLHGPEKKVLDRMIQLCPDVAKLSGGSILEVAHGMYAEIMQALDEAAKDDSTLTVITGCGDYFSSGNDLKDFSENVDEIMKDDGKLLAKFIHHFVDFPKPLVALVNGPAIGLAACLLGLCDIVYATDRATIHMPFSQMGFSPEGCSSYTFPKIMGPAQANEMLLFNKKITADEACTKGLVTEVFADTTFQGEVWTRLKAYANLPKNSLAVSKQLMRRVEKEILHAVSLQESKLLVKKFFSDECNNGLLSFFQKKSKL